MLVLDALSLISAFINISSTSCSLWSLGTDTFALVPSRGRSVSVEAIGGIQRMREAHRMRSAQGRAQSSSHRSLQGMDCGNGRVQSCVGLRNLCQMGLWHSHTALHPVTAPVQQRSMGSGVSIRRKGYNDVGPSRAEQTVLIVTISGRSVPRSHADPSPGFTSKV